MKKVLAILLAACLALSLAACGGSGSSAPVSTAPDTSGSAPASAPAAADGSIAVFYYTYSDTYISTVRTALDAELDKLGVEYQDYDSNSQQNTQTEQVDTAITKGEYGRNQTHAAVRLSCQGLGNRLSNSLHLKEIVKYGTYQRRYDDAQKKKKDPEAGEGILGQQIQTF